MKKIFASVPLLALLIIPPQGCASLFSSLPDINVAVTDGMLVLDTISSFSSTYFGTHPDAGLSTKVFSGITKAREALDVALRAAKASKNLSQAEYDAAFAGFETAYTELTALVDSIGIKTSSSPDGSKSLKASPAGLVIPKPLALSLKL